MAILTVGSGLQYTKVSTAVAAAVDGDTIYVQAGTYANDFSVINKKISIVGVGGMAHFTSTAGNIGNGKGIFVTSKDVSFDHVEMSGAKVGDGNGAGIRHHSGVLTVTNSYLHDNQNGILAGALGRVSIDQSEFARNGAGDGRTHNIYVGKNESFSFTNSYTHDAKVGHELKTRAESSLIENSRNFDNLGTASYNIDLPNGGSVVVRGNVIQQGTNTQNNKMMTFGVETSQPQWPEANLLIEDNVFVNDRNSTSARVLNNANTGVTAEFLNNDYWGLTASQIATGNNSQTGNIFLASRPTLNTSSPVAASPWNKIIWTGAAGGTVQGTSVRDLFVGATGNDTFSLTKGGNSDTIANFQAGTGIGDIVKLTNFGFSGFASAKAAMGQSGPDVVLDLGAGETLTFQKHLISDFVADDFVFAGTVVNPPGGTPQSPASLPRPQPFALAESGRMENIFGKASSGTLNGTTKNDMLDVRGTMNGAAGDDTYFVRAAGDVVNEVANQGADTVRSYISYVLPANVENLTLEGSALINATGNSLNNIIKGNDGKNTLVGGAGNDILMPGAGADILTGGTGNDIFDFTKLGSLNQITDFQLGADLIDVRDLLANYNGSNPVADGYMAIQSNGQGGSLLLLDPTHSGTMVALANIQNVVPSTLYSDYDILW